VSTLSILLDRTFPQVSSKARKSRLELLHSYGLTSDWKPFNIARRERERYASSRKSPIVYPQGRDKPQPEMEARAAVLPRHLRSAFNKLYARKRYRVRHAFQS